MIQALLFLLAASSNILVDPAFTEGNTHWANTSPVCILEDGFPSLLVNPDDEISFPAWYQEFTLAPGTLIEATVEGFTTGTKQGYGTYCSISWFSADNKRILFDQSGPVSLNNQWSKLTVRSAAPENAAKGRLSLLLNGRGKARFQNPVIRILQEPRTQALPELSTVQISDTPRPHPLFGFGAEDDGWFYNALNREKGVDHEAIRIREERISNMGMDWVRMFFWYRDWNPSGDLKTFTFDTDNMESHYKSLALYQKLGVDITVTGVEWAVKDPFNPPEDLAHAIGELFEELIVRRGFTCIKHWILTNEPNVSFHQKGGTFESYTQIHHLVREEFIRRNLDVKIIGSDDTNGGFNWFQQCVGTPEYATTCDAFVSHRYLKYDALHLMPWFFKDRHDAMQTTGTQDKPLLIAEFGFQDHRSGTTQNPLMQHADYALWAMAFVCEGMNQGASGFNIWCLHGMYYPGGQKMNYGLWNFDETWSLRPVFHAWSMLTQNTKAGDPIYTCSTNHPDLKITRINNTIFFANLGNANIALSTSSLYVNTMEQIGPHMNSTTIKLNNKTDSVNIGAKRFGRLYTQP